MTDSNFEFEHDDDARIPMPPSAKTAQETSLRERATRRRTPSTVKRNDWIWIVIAGALVVVMVVVFMMVAALVGLDFASAASNEDDSTSIAVMPTPVDARVDYGVAPANGLPSRLTLANGEEIRLTPWDGQERMTLLFLGLDRRPGENGLGYRTDTIILISIDPATNEVGLLSIPRDLYVAVPGYSARQRINTAMALGELQRTGYGPSMALLTVQQNFNIPIDDYFVADFTALVALIDAIGGIDVNVEKPITDYQFPDMNYGYDPLVLSPGLQHMDGYTAQKYARTRHGDSDFDRARRQQDVLFAIRDQLLSLESLPSMVLQAPSLYASVQENVVTSMTLEEMLRLALYVKDVPQANIHTAVLDADYVSDFMTDEGADVLVPHEGSVPWLMAQTFGEDYWR